MYTEYGKYSAKPATSKYDFHSGKETTHNGQFVAEGGQGNSKQPSPALFGWWLVLISHPGHTKAHVLFFFLRSFQSSVECSCDSDAMHCFYPTNYTAVT